MTDEMDVTDEMDEAIGVMEFLPLVGAGVSRFQVENGADRPRLSTGMVNVLPVETGSIFATMNALRAMDAF